MIMQNSFEATDDNKSHFLNIAWFNFYRWPNIILLPNLGTFAKYGEVDIWGFKYS